MRVPYSDIRAEYMDRPDRRVFDLRRDGIPDVPVLGWCSYSRARPDLPAHRHWGALEIHYLDRGYQAFEVEGQEYRLSGGDLFVTQQNETHSTGGFPVEPCVLYWLLVRIPKPGRSLLRLPAQESASMVEALESLPARQFRGSPRTREVFDRLLELHGHADNALRRTRMRAAALQLLLEVVDCASQLAGTGSDSSMKAIAQLIESQPSEEFQIKTLARRAGLSMSWFKTRFKVETGLSPGHFILRSKIEAACRRLLVGKEPISQIAGDLGFSNSQYFATVFRRFKGMPPRDYRLKGATHQPSNRIEDGQS